MVIMMREFGLNAAKRMSEPLITVVLPALLHHRKTFNGEGSRRNSAW